MLLPRIDLTGKVTQYVVWYIKNEQQYAVAWSTRKEKREHEARLKRVRGIEILTY